MASSSAGDDGADFVEGNTHSLLTDPQFMELRNFLPARGRDFRDTCFIAVVANLRHLLRPVRLETSKRTWTELVTFVRQEMRNDKSELLFSASDGTGQHDAALLLSEFLGNAPITTFGTRIRKMKYMSCCEQTLYSFETLPMIVLTLPPAPSEYSLSTLIKFYEKEAKGTRMECDFCSSEGKKHYAPGKRGESIYDTVDGKMVFRFNRYDGANRRGDRILLDSSITSKNGDTYNLEAILQHQGVSMAGGHYIIFVLVSGRWEERDDAEVRRTNLEYNPSNVRMLET